MESKKAQNQIGIAIIVMALLLLVGGIFLDPNNTNSKNLGNFNSNFGGTNSNNLNPNYLFYLGYNNLGQQRKVTQNYPNIVLGAKEEFNTIFQGNNFRLNANPFTSQPYSFQVDMSNYSQVNYLLLYFNSKKLSGNQDLIILVNGKVVSKNKVDSTLIPIKIYNRFNSSKIVLTFLIEKPSWYSFFNWNKFDISDLKVVEVKKDRSNSKRKFDFFITKNFLESVYLDMIVSCDNAKKISEPIELSVNGYILSNANPDCSSRNNRITAKIPVNILSNKGNRIEFKTNGFYHLAYSINKIYFNDQQTYKFNIANFNDFNEVTMHGDFNLNVADIMLNGIRLSLNRGDYKSIFNYLRIGVNEITFLNKPMQIKKFVIEKSFFKKNKFGDLDVNILKDYVNNMVPISKNCYSKTQITQSLGNGALVNANIFGFENFKNSKFCRLDSVLKIGAVDVNVKQYLSLDGKTLWSTSFINNTVIENKTMVYASKKCSFGNLNIYSSKYQSSEFIIEKGLNTFKGENYCLSSSKLNLNGKLYEFDYLNSIDGNKHYAVGNINGKNFEIQIRN